MTHSSSRCWLLSFSLHLSRPSLARGMRDLATLGILFTIFGCGRNSSKVPTSLSMANGEMVLHSFNHWAKTTTLRLLNTHVFAASGVLNVTCGAVNTGAANGPALCGTGATPGVTSSIPWTLLCGGGSSTCNVSPLGASAFLQSLGINTHLGYPSTPYYGQPQSVITALQYLGVHTIRNSPPGYDTDATTTATNQALGIAGVHYDALLPGSGSINLPAILSGLATFLQTYPGSVAAIEGPNEINAWPIRFAGALSTYSAGNQLSQSLWSAVQSDPSLSAVPVYALTLSNGIPGVTSGTAQLGNLAPYVTYGNAHVYACCSNNVWQRDMPYWLPIFAQVTPGKPIVLTETGYPTVPANVDEIAAAKYNLNTLFENALNGLSRTYLFELVDLNSSPADSNAEDHYGQFHDDWSPKAGATAIHNLTTILQGAGPGTNATSLNYSVSGLPATGRSFLLGSNTGFDLAIWVDATIYNPSNATDIVASPYTATINLGATYSSVQVFDPLQGTTPIAVFNQVSAVPVSVTDHPVILQIN